MIKSPLRYPGGKSRAIKTIVQYLPDGFSEYREPFVGGGSLFIYLKQKYPHLKIWINDLNPELFCFWKVAQSDLDKLVEEVFKIKNDCQDGKLLFQELTNVSLESLSYLKRAVRFFVLNRITFSGTVESGGFSQQAFQKRFTVSCIERLSSLKEVCADIKITNLDYSDLLTSDNKSTFVFLDPPYWTATKSKLYGKRGILHTAFDHQRFAKTIANCRMPWLITYDDCPEVRTNFQLYNIYQWQLQYGMNNYKQARAVKGKELFLCNYQVVSSLENKSTKNFEQLSLL